jgi:aldehyde:ferredoxin oxidoreductase
MSIRLLRIRLDSRQATSETLPEYVEHQFLGGRGVAAWLLASRVPASVGPRSAANLIIFSTGPLTGAIPAATGGFVVTARSPLTGSLAHSWALGRWGSALRRAGFDMLTLEGQSEEWCVVQVDNGATTIMPAGELLGLDTLATTRALEQMLGSDYTVVAVGPAGEAGVAYSSIVAEGLYPAEPAGTGAVMAHKRVKAIAVRGSSRLTPAELPRVEAVVAGVTKRVAASDLASGIRQYGGSLYYAEAAEQSGALVGRNGQDAHVPHSQAIGRAVLAQRGQRKPRGCEGCILPCASSYVRRNGDAMAFPELEAWAGFGGACSIANPDTIIIANDLCVRLGLDVAATAAALAFMMECQQLGLSRSANLAWGDSEALLSAIRRLGQRQEKRDVLSLGVGEIQDVYYGSGSFAPQVKGMAMPALDPRALHEFAVAYATAPIGSDYRYGMSYAALLSDPPAWLPEGQQSAKSVVPRLIWHERFAASLDAAGLCRRLALMAYQVTPSEATELIAATLGHTFSGVEMARLGERIVTFERLLALHYEADADTLPRRWLTTPLAEGPAAGQSIPIQQLVEEYYRRHGWDEQGVPTPARLAELGIDPLMDE